MPFHPRFLRIFTYLNWSITLILVVAYITNELRNNTGSVSSTGEGEIMKFMSMLLISIGLAASFPISVASELRVASESSADGYSPKETFRTSLHGTRLGKEAFWRKEHGGIEKLIGESMDEFGCIACHGDTMADGTPIDPVTYTPSCADCHVDPGNPGPVTDDICLNCHVRQVFEKMFLRSETHVNLAHEGFACTTCHTSREMHGDENVYSSLLTPGAMDAKCENCHTIYPARNTDSKLHASYNARNVYHKIHQKTLDCSACHVQSVIACNSCHLDSARVGQNVFVIPPHQNFKMLVERPDGKVHAATYVTITYGEEKTFSVIAPNHAHAITKDGISCGDCHGNSAIQEYNETGKINVITWDKKKNALVGREGVIPVPYDWKEALRFDYVVPTLNPDKPWMLLKGETDRSQMLFGEGLSRRQLDFLRNPPSE
jgi:hypothetical protein